VCLRTNNKIVPLTNLNKYLYSDKSEMRVNVNNSSEKSKKKKKTLSIGELVTAECASVAYVYIYCT
jgi:hypothetical protein